MCVNLSLLEGPFKQTMFVEGTVSRGLQLLAYPAQKSFWKTWTVFTTLYFLRNLHMGQISWTVCLWQAFTVWSNHRAILLEATSYISVIRKLQESWPTRVGSNNVTSVNTHKYILLRYQKNVRLKRNKNSCVFYKMH